MCLVILIHLYINIYMSSHNTIQLANIKIGEAQPHTEEEKQHYQQTPILFRSLCAQPPHMLGICPSAAVVAFLVGACWFVVLKQKFCIIDRRRRRRRRRRCSLT
jgi:hypothetical protein